MGLSGGVDSTAAALLLKRQGYEVIGYYFDVLGSQKQGAERAQRAAEELDIEFIYRDVKNEFEAQVIRPFCHEYETGRTPNPCVICNPTVKFKTMAQEADRVGAFWLATGHYARVIRPEKGTKAQIQMAKNRRKDQSYMLYRLPEEILRRLILPLGEIEDKKQVRELVRGFGIFNADASDSQEICFIPDGDYVEYLQSRGVKIKEGDFLDGETGEIIGTHRGIVHYTIGQRKGLGMTFGRPRFVTRLDSSKNTVTLGGNEALLSPFVTAKDCVILGAFGKEGQNRAKELIGRPLQGKIRYAASPSDCMIQRVFDETIEIVFQTPQRAATPGQSVVLYDREFLVGGGFITDTNLT